MSFGFRCSGGATTGALKANSKFTKAGVVNFELSMSKPFDFDIGRLTGSGNDFTRAAVVFPRKPEAFTEAVGRGTFFLETFGCQMNDHDSEKVAGVLLARGYRQVETPEAAGLILYNTCSIREKAAQKVFSRLGEYRARQSEGKIIGVLGCLAQQEGEDIFERAPWVSLVCGSASYRKLPEMLAQLEASIVSPCAGQMQHSVTTSLRCSRQKRSKIPWLPVLSLSQSFLFIDSYINAIPMTI